jgi:septum formation protein
VGEALAQPGRVTGLVLASASPRRRELLRGLGLRFEVCPPDVDETVLADEAGDVYVERLARDKAVAVAAPGTVTVAADTTVDLEGDLLGKPADPPEARSLLHRLSGRTHRVHTGVAVAVASAPEPDGAGTTARVWSEVATTAVTFSVLPHAWIEWYVTGDEPYDKAGGYGIQGAAGLFVARIDGSPSNVVGLPLDVVARLVAAAGHDLLSFTA